MGNRVLSSLIAPIQFAMGSHRVHWRGSQELESFCQLAAGLKLPQVELEHTAALEKTPAYETNGSWKDFRNNGFDGIDEQSQTSILTMCMRKGFTDWQECSAALEAFHNACWIVTKPRFQVRELRPPSLLCPSVKIELFKRQSWCTRWLL